MVSRRRLSKDEKRIIRQMDKDKVPVVTIARETGRHCKTIRACLSHPDDYGTHYSAGAPRTLSERTIRRAHLDMSRDLLDDEAGGVVTLQKTIDEMDFGVSKRTLTQTVPSLSEPQRKKRRKWVDRHLRKPINWNKVVFSDEKKFTLGRPDGYRRRWVNTSHGMRLLTKSSVKQRSLNVWAGFSVYGRKDIAIFKDNENAKLYQGLLQRNLFPYMRERRNMVFQQDNALSHTAGSTKRLLGQQKFRTMDWPANSSDLNPIENVWGLMTHLTYRVGRLPRNSNELAAAIRREWWAIPQKELRKLAISMKCRHTGKY